MVLGGILGFQSVLYAVLLFAFVVIRLVWRNAEAKKDEIITFVENAAIAEMEANSAEYSSVSVSEWFQCAVCYSPTTMRCSRCKAIRYCSGKCQIIHWRQGHKDECCPPITTMWLEEESLSHSHRVAVSEMQSGFHDIKGTHAGFADSIDSCSSTNPAIFHDIKGTHAGIADSNDSCSSVDHSVFHYIKGTRAGIADSNNSCSSVNPSVFHDIKGTHAGIANSNDSCSSIDPSVLHDIKGTRAGNADSNNSCSGVNPSVAARKSFDDGRRSRLAKPACDNTADDTAVASAHPNETVLSPSVPLVSKNYVNTDVTDSSASKRSKRNSSKNADETGFKSKFPKTKSDTSHDVAANLGGHEHRRKVSMVEKSVTDTYKCRTMTSLNNSSTDSVADNVEAESHLSKYKEGPRFSSSSGDHLSSAPKGDLLSHSKISKTDNYHALPAKFSGVPNQPQNVCNVLKTSVQKVVQQFRSSKESRFNVISVENEMSFPYELFMELYCYDKVKLFPFGLTNCGNSCYANAVLQCLAYTRPLTSYLFQGFHSKQCQKKGWCFICEFEYLIQKAKEGNSPLSPIGILSKIHKIASHLGHGREEDAHEFLRCAVDTMQSICLKETGRSSPLAEETTLIGYTFGGYLRSKIKCLRCMGKSERYERMMDLSVEIDGDIGTLEEALGQFTAPEILDKDNKYNCSRCKSYEKARKKLTVLEAPNILTIVLKRFQSDNFEKLNKSVQFPEVLNMAPYMSGTKDKSPLYSLYAVVVHLDIMNAAFSGHYVCYVKTIQGEWFRTDDSRVEPVELSRVLSERAYMLLYARHCPKPLGLVNSNAISSAGKFKRRNLEAIPATSKTRSNSVATIADSPSLQQRQYPYWNAVNDSLSNEFVYPELWRFNYGGRDTMVDSSSESSSLFSSSDASSCSTASIKESANSADFSDYIFGEVGSNWFSHYGFASNSVPSSYDNLSTDILVDCDDSGRQRQDSEDKAVSYGNKNKNHSGGRGIDLRRYVAAIHYDKNSSVHVRTSRDASAQTFC